MDQVREAVRRDSINVPEQVQLEYAFESGECSQPGVGEWAVDEQPRPFAIGGFEKRKVVQQRNAGIRDKPPGAEPA